MNIVFNCSHCNRALSSDDSYAGRAVTCPSCGKPTTIPPPESPAPAPGSIMYCPSCGQPNPENNFRCDRCRAVLHPNSKPQFAASDDNTLGGLIPYKNAAALWAYYLGIFSLIPCVGIPIGVAAVIMGLRGQKYAALYPEAKGKGHALAGIILGSLSVIGYTLLIVVPLIITSLKS